MGGRGTEGGGDGHFGGFRRSGRATPENSGTLDPQPQFSATESPESSLSFSPESPAPALSETQPGGEDPPPHPHPIQAVAKSYCHF